MGNDNMDEPRDDEELDEAEAPDEGVENDDVDEEEEAVKAAEAYDEDALDDEVVAESPLRPIGVAVTPSEVELMTDFGVRHASFVALVN